MTKTFPILAAVLAGLGGLMAACASEPAPAPRGPPPGAAEPETPRSRLFISPAGQPFRSKPGQEAPVDTWWRQVDKNGDGVVTLDEFQQDFMAFFKLLDRDGDGQIDGFEVSIYENDMVPEILPEVGARDSLGEPIREGRGGRARGRRGGGSAAPGILPGAGGGQGAAPFALTPDPEPVRAADYDLSQKVSRAEFERRAREVFALLDTNHDGKLTLDELPKPPQPGQGRRGGRRQR